MNYDHELHFLNFMNFKAFFYRCSPAAVAVQVSFISSPSLRFRVAGLSILETAVPIID